MCAVPRAPPPESTSPTRGRWWLSGVACGSGFAWASLMVGAASQAARKRPSTRIRGATARVELTARRIPALPRAALGLDSQVLRAIADNATHDALRSQEHPRSAVARRGDARRAGAGTRIE